MHHLTDAEFRQARDDMYEGLQSYLGAYTSYAKLARAWLKLQIAPDDVPHVFGLVHRLLPLLDSMRDFEAGMESIKTAESPAELLQAMRTISENIQVLNKVVADAQRE